MCRYYRSENRRQLSFKCVSAKSSSAITFLVERIRPKSAAGSKARYTRRHIRSSRSIFSSQIAVVDGLKNSAAASDSRRLGCSFAARFHAHDPRRCRLVALIPGASNGHVSSANRSSAVSGSLRPAPLPCLPVRSARSSFGWARPVPGTLRNAQPAPRSHWVASAAHMDQ